MSDEKKSAVDELVEKIGASTGYIISSQLASTAALILSAIYGFGEFSFYMLAATTVIGWISAIYHFKKIGISIDWKSIRGKK